MSILEFIIEATGMVINNQNPYVYGWGILGKKKKKNLIEVIFSSSVTGINQGP